MKLSFVQSVFVKNGSRFLSSLQEKTLKGTANVLRVVGPVYCSNICAYLMRNIGPYLSISRVARQNLQFAFPDMHPNEHERIVRGAWDNLGRVIGEFPHLHRLQRTAIGPGWEVEGTEHIDTASKDQKAPLFFSAHFGNWEMILPIAASLGIPVGGVYRTASNAVVDRFLQDIRLRAAHGAQMFPKGRLGARAMLSHLISGGSLGLLVDQKMNDGISLPFFDRDAWTAPALAQLAIRFQRQIVPVRVVRIGPARFRLICEPALNVTLTDNRHDDERSIMTIVNKHVEKWITADPHLWLWFHRRWPKIKSGENLRLKTA